MKSESVLRVMWRESASPWSMDYEPKVIAPPNQPDMRDLTFTYLWGQKVYRPASGPLSELPSLRHIAKNFSPKVLQEGPKCKLVCRLMLQMSRLVDARRASWETAFEPHRARYYAILSEKFIVRPTLRAPPERQLLDDMPLGRERARFDRDGLRTQKIVRRAPEDCDITKIEHDGDHRNLAAITTTATTELGSGESANSVAGDAAAAGTSLQNAAEDDEMVVDINTRSVPPPTTATTSAAADAHEISAMRGVDEIEQAENDADCSVAPLRACTAPSLTVSEYARLVALLARDCEARSVSWDTELERVYNDANEDVKLDVQSVASLVAFEIDASWAPTRFRNVALLRATHDLVSALFSAAYAKWSLARHTRGARGTPFCNFVNAAAGTTRLSKLGTMCCILFVAARIGAPDQHQHLVDIRSIAVDRPAKRRRVANTDPRPIVRLPHSTAGANVAAAMLGNGDTDRAQNESLLLDGASRHVDGTHDRANGLTQAGEQAACCSRAVERAIAAAVTAAVEAGRSERETDIVHVFATLNKLWSMRTDGRDESMPDFLMRYLDKEISSLRRRIELHQRDLIP